MYLATPSGNAFLLNRFSTLTIDSVTNGTGGTVTRNDNGTVTFTPSAGFFGAANFTYVVSDGSLKSAPTTKNGRRLARK